MRSAKCVTLFTCQTLVATATEVAAELSVPLSRIFALPLPEGFLKNPEPIDHLKSLEQLVEDGSRPQPLEPLTWAKGRAKEQIAYLCATSGTSGKQVWRVIIFASLNRLLTLGPKETGHDHPL